MDQKHTLVQVWGALFRSGAVAEAKRMFLASGDNAVDAVDEVNVSWAGGFWFVAPIKQHHLQWRG